MTDNKIIVLGAGGQVGRACAALLGNRALALPRSSVDMARADFLASMEKALGATPVAAVINAAAYTQVDKAESEPALAMRVNAEAVGELASWCAKRGVPLVHFSTDYVFGDNERHAHTENDATNPLNAYGQSKLAGEQAAMAAGGKTLIFRTSWVYDAAGRNFFNTVHRLFGEKDELRVVNDQFGAPTYAPHLARSCLAALDKALAAKTFPSGVYHLCHAGEASWFDFAQAIFALARSHDSGIRCQRIIAIPTAEYPTPAKRPANSRLDCSKAKSVLGVALPHWENGLQACSDEIYGHSGLQHRRPQTRSSQGE